MFKKIFLFVAFTSFITALNAFEIDDKELAKQVADTLARVQQEQTVKPAPYYGYSPIVFEVRSVYRRNITEQMQELGRKMIAVDPMIVSIPAPDVTIKCYATVINKEWLLTHKSCVYLQKASDAYTFTLKTIKFYRGDYKAVVDTTTSKLKYYEDKGTGAVLLNVKSVCLDTTEKTSTGVCMRFWDWLLDESNGPYVIQDNYSSIILGNVSALDFRNKAFKLAFTKRAFFTPTIKGKAITIDDIYVRTLKLPKDLLEIGNPLPGEPLFHKNALNEQILVAVNSAVGAEARKYNLFGPAFTALLKKIKVSDPQSIIITTDLNGYNKI